MPPQSPVTRVVVTGIATLAALLAIIAFAWRGAWGFAFELTNIEDRVVAQLQGRLTRLEEKVEDVKEEERAVAEDAPSASADPSPALTVGDTVRGNLTVGDDHRLVDGSLFDDWHLIVAGSDTIIVEMVSEDDDLDPFLFLWSGSRLNPDSMVLIGANDDGGENLNARLEIAVEPGDYVDHCEHVWQRHNGVVHTIGHVRGSAEYRRARRPTKPLTSGRWNERYPESDGGTRESCDPSTRVQRGGG